MEEQFDLLPFQQIELLNNLSSSKAVEQQLILMSIINCSCFFVLSNSYSNKKTPEKGTMERKLHFTLDVWT